jgi:hypothetical protein
VIGITISGIAYAAIALTLPASSAADPKIDPDQQYQVWLPRAVVDRLRSLREPSETFSDVILRLARSAAPTLPSRDRPTLLANGC